MSCEVFRKIVEMEHKDELTNSYEIDWLKRCLPVIVQPQVDIKNQNQLIRIFYKFGIDEQKGQCICRICMIYASESSYSCKDQNVMNPIATFLYRSYNRKAYQRTADINYLEYRGVDLDPNSPRPWQTIFTTDYSGKQKWSNGDGGNILLWFSLMRHYKVDIPFGSWKKYQETFRPYLYLNTCNHLCGEEDNNLELEKYLWVNYAVQDGGAQAAHNFSQHHVPTKWNFYSLCLFCFAKNGRGCFDQTKQNNVEHMSNILDIK